MNKVIAVIIFLIGLVTYILAPLDYNYSYSIICGIFFLIIIIMYYTVRKKDNYFDFDSLFFFTFFFVTLYFPIFMYETEAERYVMFTFPFDKDVIPRASALALLAASSYMFGSLFFISPEEVFISKQTFKEQDKVFEGQRPISNKFLFLFAAGLFLVYIAMGGYQEMQEMYDKSLIKRQEAGLGSYILVFLPTFLYSAIILEFYNIRLKSTKIRFKDVSLLAYFSVGFIFFLVLVTGSRTIPLQIILLIVGLYALLFNNIGSLKFLISVVLGLGLMFSVVLLRGYDQDTEVTYGDALMDLIINNRSSFLAFEKVEDTGYTYGESMLSSIVAPVPLLQNLLVESGFDHNKMSSARFFTEYTFGEITGDFGLGTNVIADIYLAFGVVGVVVLMLLLGFVINYYRVHFYKNIYCLAVYGIFMSFAVYLVRAEFFFFLRNLTWVLVIIFMTKTKFRFN